MKDWQKERQDEITRYALELVARRGLLNTPQRMLLAFHVMDELNGKRHNRKKKGRKHDENSNV